MELSTTYMGLHLRNPIVASRRRCRYTLDGIRRLADAGVGAIVLYSLFEEQLREEAALVRRSSMARPRASPRRSTTCPRSSRRTPGRGAT